MYSKRLFCADISQNMPNSPKRKFDQNDSPKHLQQQRKRLPDRQPQMCAHRVVTSHTRQCEGEISLEVGDVVTHVKQLGNGWALGHRKGSQDGCEDSTVVGIFPSDCLKRLEILVVVPETTRSSSIEANVTSSLNENLPSGICQEERESFEIGPCSRLVRIYSVSYYCFDKYIIFRLYCPFAT